MSNALFMFQINVMFTFVLGSLIISHALGIFTSENVVFQKTNEVFINDAKWSVTFVHDLRPFQKLINQIKNDLVHTDEIVKTITNFYERSNMTGYVKTFKSLHIEVDLLTDTYNSVYDNFAEYQSLSVNGHRSQRPLIPIIGQLMSTLFGTVSENDLENINRNIKALAGNQKQIIHDLDVSLSVLNLTRMQVSENIRSIMDLIIVVQKLDRKIFDLKQVFSAKFVRLEQFVHTYLQFQMILDEIKQTTQDAVFYLESLKSELNMLSMQLLSTNTISPKDLKKLLIEVESKLPNNFELPRNPRKDIWYFYKTLTSITYLEDNEIRIVLKIPLINTKEEYEVYSIYNLPLPMATKQTNIMLKYTLETDMLMVSKDRRKFSLLTESAFHMCNSFHYRFCNPETAFYQANINRFCVVALFMQNQRDIKTFCKQIVILDQKLHLTSYLSYGLWIIVTNVPLTFTINCQSHKQKTYDIKIESPFGIIKLNNTCKASNKYLQLPEYFGKHSYFERSDPLQALLKLHNITNFSIWNDSKTNFVKLKSLKLPSHLLDLKEIPMQNYLRETGIYKSVNVDNVKSSTNWTVVAIISIASVLCIIIIVWFMLCKFKCSQMNRIIGKRWANNHDFERVNVKHSPSDGEDVEMSAILKEQNGVDDLEGQQTSFKRTDATLAWAK